MNQNYRSCPYYSKKIMIEQGMFQAITNRPRGWLIRCDVTAIWHLVCLIFRIWVTSSNLDLVKLDSAQVHSQMWLGNCAADTTKRYLKVMYTNTDQFINKRDLCLLICSDHPDVIFLTKTIPKAQRLPMDLALLHIPGYVLFTNLEPSMPNLGKSSKCGICVYVSHQLKVAEAVQLNGDHQWPF